MSSEHETTGRNQCRPGGADTQCAGISARRHCAGAAAVDRGDDHGGAGSFAHRPRAVARAGAPARNQGDRHRRRISDPRRHHPAAVAEPPSNDADRHHAAPGVAGARSSSAVFPTPAIWRSAIGRPRPADCGWRRSAGFIPRPQPRSCLPGRRRRSRRSSGRRKPASRSPPQSCICASWRWSRFSTSRWRAFSRRRCAVCRWPVS